MDERAIEAVVPGVELEVETQRVGDVADDRIAGDRVDRPHRVLAAGERQRVIRAAAGTTSQLDHLVGSDPGALRHVEAQGHGPGDRGVLRDRRAPGTEHDLGRLRVAVDVPFRGRGRVAGRPECAAHQRIALEQAGQPGLAQHGDGEVGEWAQGDQRDLAWPLAGLVEDHVHGMAVADRGAGRRQFGVTQTLRPVRLRRRLQGALERHLAAHRDLDIRAPGQFQDGPRVDAHLVGIDVAGHTGDRHEVSLRRCGRVEQGQTVVDAGVDIEDERDPVGHRRMLAGSAGSLSPSPPRIDGPVARPRVQDRQRGPGRCLRGRTCQIVIP